MGSQRSDFNRTGINKFVNRLYKCKYVQRKLFGIINQLFVFIHSVIKVKSEIGDYFPSSIITPPYIYIYIYIYIFIKTIYIQTIYIYIYIYIYICHHVVLVARISLTLSRHSSLSFIALGQHSVSSHSCWMYVRAGRPAFCTAMCGGP